MTTGLEAFGHRRQRGNRGDDSQHEQRALQGHVLRIALSGLHQDRKYEDSPEPRLPKDRQGFRNRTFAGNAFILCSVVSDPPVAIHYHNL